jgi:hypothetical protein
MSEPGVSDPCDPTEAAMHEAGIQTKAGRDDAATMVRLLSQIVDELRLIRERLERE